MFCMVIMLNVKKIILQVHYCNTCTSTLVSGHMCLHTSVVEEYEWKTNVGEVTSFNTWIHSFLDTICQNILFHVGKTRNILIYNKFHLSLNLLNFLKGTRQRRIQFWSEGSSVSKVKYNESQLILEYKQLGHSTTYATQMDFSFHMTYFRIQAVLVTAVCMQPNKITHFNWLTLVYK